jgi:uncharacterized tellurite resistance protein B-like protein
MSQSDLTVQLNGSSALTRQGGVEMTFAAGALEVIQHFLASLTNEYLTAHDLSKLDSFRTGLRDYKARIPEMAGARSALERVEQCLVEATRMLEKIQGRATQATRSVSQVLEGVRQTAQKSLAGTDKWAALLIGSEDRVMNHLASALQCQAHPRIITRVDLVDIPSGHRLLETWAGHFKQLQQTVDLKQQELQDLAHEMTRIMTAFLGLSVGMVVSEHDVQSRPGSDVQQGLFPAGLSSLQSHRTCEFFFSYLQQLAGPGVLAIEPKLESVMKVAAKFKAALPPTNAALAAFARETENAMSRLATFSQWFEELACRDRIEKMLAGSVRKLRQALKQHTERIEQAARQARLGHFEQARKTHTQLTSQGHTFELPYEQLEQHVQEEMRRLALLRTLTSQCQQEHQRLDTKWNNFWGSDVEELQNRLKVTSQAFQKIPWDENSDGWKMAQALIQKLSPICEFAEISVSWRPVNLNSPKQTGRPRQVPAEQAFIQALCAMGASDGDFCAEEQRAVLAIAQKYTPDLAQEQIVALIRAWTSAARTTGVVNHIQQTVLDAANLRGTRYAAIAKAALTHIMNADGEHNSNELFVLNAIMQRLA